MLSLENVVNRLKRHCRIKTVQWKARPAPSLKSLLDWKPVYPAYPVFNDWVPHQCKQCEGKACGNVACPMRLTVTC